jgi:hypothetical protein
LNLILLTRAEEERILPNVKDEPRPSLARLVHQYVEQFVLFLRRFVREHET